MKNRQMQALLTGPDGLGTLLRAARGHRSMQQLADALADITDDDAKVGKWNSSKVSKLETGQQLPNEAEIDLWANVTGADAATRRRWHKLRGEADSKRAVYRRRTSAVRETAGSAGGQLERVAATIRVAQLNVIPELLQVEGYTRAVWSATHPDADVSAAVDGLRERQKALHEPDKKFQFLIGEAALRTIRGSEPVMAAQLDRLVTVASLDTVTIGVIPLGRVLRGPLVEAGVVLYDLDEAVVSDGVEDHRYTGGTAALLRERFDAAWGDAVEGRQARRLIIEITDSLGLD